MEDSEVTVVTACYGDDTLQEQPKQTIPVRWVGVTDRPQQSNTWDVVVEPRSHLTPRMAAKIPKCMTSIYGDVSSTIIWLDGAVQLQRDDAIEHFISFLGENDVVSMPHPNWQSVVTEAVNTADLRRFDGQMYHEQAKHYLRSPIYVDDHVWATAVVVRRITHENIKRIIEFERTWLVECARWSASDQMSAPWAEKLAGIRWGRIEEHLWTTPYLTLRIRPRDI